MVESVGRTGARPRARRGALAVALLVTSLAVTAPGTGAATAHVTELVSVSLTGGPGNAGSGVVRGFWEICVGRDGLALDRTGERVVFHSDADDLVVGDGNDPTQPWLGAEHGTDVFLRRRTAGVTTRESMGTGDLVESDVPSCEVDIASDGATIAFATLASDATFGPSDGPGDPEPDWDVMWRDVDGDVTESVNPVGSTAWDPRVGSDGRWVSYRSDSKIDGDDTNGRVDVYAYDRLSHSHVLVSRGPGGVLGDDDVIDHDMAATGRYVAFTTEARNFATPVETTGDPDVFVRDSLAGTTQLISADPGGTPVGGDQVAISPTGRYVAFRSCSDALVASDTNGRCDVFRKDRFTGAMRLVSVRSVGGGADGASGEPSISDDGRYVAFSSDATDLVADDTNGDVDVFVRDLVAGTTTRVSVDVVGNEADGDSALPALSGDGTTVAFATSATDLVANDGGGGWDVVVRDVDGGVTVDAPGAPQDLAAVPDDQVAVVSWSPPADDGGLPVLGYTATLQPGGVVHEMGPGELTTTFTGLPNGVEHTVAVVASSAVGPSDPATTTATPRTVPGAPIDVRAFAVDGGVEVWWSLPADDGGSPITGVGITAATTYVNGGPTSGWAFLGGLPDGVPVAPTFVASNAAGDGPVATAAAVTPHVCGNPLLFIDVTVGHPFCEDVAWAVDWDVTTGYPDGGFHPAQDVSRMALVAMLYRLAGSPDGADPGCVAAPFPDVGISHPFCGEIAWATDAGIVTGYADGGFHPAGTITRQAFVVMAYRQAGSPEGADPACAFWPFSDITPVHPFCGEIQWASDAGITGGYADGSFRPTQALERQALAAMLHRASRRYLFA